MRSQLQPTSPLWGGRKTPFAFFGWGSPPVHGEAQTPPEISSRCSQISTSPQEGGKVETTLQHGESRDRSRARDSVAVAARARIDRTPLSRARHVAGHRARAPH